MEIAKYIMSILKKQMLIGWSWVFHTLVEIKNG